MDPSLAAYGISHSNRGLVEPWAHLLACLCFFLQAVVMKCSVPVVVQLCAMHDKEQVMVGDAWGKLCNPAAGTKLQARSHAVGR